jgi:hypothetical protein
MVIESIGHQTPLAKTATSGLFTKLIAKHSISLVGLYNNTFNDASDQIIPCFFCLL